MADIKTGSFIALAWPETQVIKEGKWYDTVTQFLGFLKNNRYTVGHAALLLVNHRTGLASYFDFGRYHTPFQFGRVRSAFTDPELEMKTSAIITNGIIENIPDILAEIAQNPSNHGDGKMSASVFHGIDFEKALQAVLEIQNQGVVAYSPLNNGATNCSRFVATTALAGGISKWQKILLQFPYTFSPSPRSNVRIIGNENCFYEVNNDQVTCYPKSILSLSNMFKTKFTVLETEPIPV